MNPRLIARRLGVGRALLRLKRAREDGFVYTLRYWAASERMKTAARRLTTPALPKSDIQAGVGFLTGNDYWHQTAFCLYSLQRVLGQQLTNVLICDDGTLRPDQAGVLRVITPELRLMTADELNRRVAEALPAQSFPALTNIRRNYAHIRKLVDFAIAMPCASVLLDSDMLFHNHPTELADWLRNPGAPLYMQDRSEMYGCPTATMEQIAGVPMPPAVNAGVVAMDRSRIDWSELDRMAGELIAARGINYFTEQCLTAMILAQQGGKPLPPDRYVLRPDPEEQEQCRAPLHHYTLTSRLPYLTHLWKRIPTTP